MTDANNVTNIADASSPLRPIVQRLQFIKRRIEAIRHEQEALSAESAVLWKEQNKLQEAEKVVRELLERRP